MYVEFSHLCEPSSKIETNDTDIHLYRIAGIPIVSRSTRLIHSWNLTSSPVPSYATIKNNETVKIQCIDWTGGQIKNSDDANDILNVDLTRIHYITGPFEIETAEPGDVLVVEIQDVQPLAEAPWGYCGVFAKENGGGFLDEIYPKP